VSGGKLGQTLDKINFSWLFLFRAVPLIPFRFLDLSAGLTRVGFAKYITAVISGSLPRIFWLQYILAGVGRAVIREPGLLIRYLTENKAAYFFSLIYLVLMVVMVIAIKRKKNAGRG